MHIYTIIKIFKTAEYKNQHLKRSIVYNNKNLLEKYIQEAVLLTVHEKE